MKFSDMACIYSTLNVILKHAKFINIPTPVVSFGQRLWLKATEVLNKMQMCIMLLLGEFRLEMGFTGNIVAQG